MATIAIISQKGGGGTTLALHLAGAARRRPGGADRRHRSAGDREPIGRLARGCPARSDRDRHAAHADSAARAAVELADLVLIPCRPSAFDLAAIQTTAKLVQLLRKPAFVVFTAGAPNAPRVYAEAGELVEGYSTPPCPVQVPDRAAYRHASAEGRTLMELEPHGKAAEDIRQLYAWTCPQVGLTTTTRRRGRTAA